MAEINGSCSTTHGFTANTQPFGLGSLLDVDTYTGARTAVWCTAYVSKASQLSTASPSPLAATAHFVACARNVEVPLRSGRALNIEHLGERFEDYSVLVWEDGSTDGSKATLRGWAARII